MAAFTLEHPAADTAPAPRPKWHEGAIWMGASLRALRRTLRETRGRVAPAYWFDLAIDSAFAAGNSALAAGENALYSRRVRQVTLPPDPVFVLGHWRTGTTLLHELLALDPRHRSPTTYECLLPNHFLLTQRWLKPWSGFVLPRTRWFDNVAVGWDRPQEDEFALLNLGLGSPYAWIAKPNDTCRDWRFLDLTDVTTVERERWENGFQRFLQRLYLTRRGRLVLKSPPHTCRIPTPLAVSAGPLCLRGARAECRVSLHAPAVEIIVLRTRLPEADVQKPGKSGARSVCPFS
jgi:hypothetical protein